MNTPHRLAGFVYLAAFGMLSANGATAATIQAASCSLQAVQTAVNSASDGDVVKIPNGSCAWSGGISTNKQIRIEAQSYTPTKGGTMSRGVVITNNSTSAPLFSFTSGNNYHVGLAGIRFNEGSGNQNHVRFSGSGTKVPLINDCAFEFKARQGSNPGIAMIAMLSLGGVFWNSYFQGVFDPNTAPGGGIFVESPRAWTTAGTMGMDDVGGRVNVYIEDSTLKDVASAPDIDQGGRFVMRHSVIDGTWGLTHGFTSGVTGRHAEFYDNTFVTTTTSRNMAGRYFWLRGGTALFTGNSVARAKDTQSYAGGVVALLEIGDNTSPSGNDSPMQPGWGHNGTSHVRDPIYVWGNTGEMGSRVGFNDQSGCWSCVTATGSELIVNGGAKPGWSRFTYPHPARAAVEDIASAPQQPQPMAPSNVAAQ